MPEVRAGQVIIANAIAAIRRAFFDFADPVRWIACCCANFERTENWILATQLTLPLWITVAPIDVR